jgi:hypothetical protein
VCWLIPYVMDCHGIQIGGISDRPFCMNNVDCVFWYVQISVRLLVRLFNSDLSALRIRSVLNGCVDFSAVDDLHEQTEPAFVYLRLQDYVKFSVI